MIERERVIERESDRESESESVSSYLNYTELPLSECQCVSKISHFHLFTVEIVVS